MVARAEHHIFLDFGQALVDVRHLHARGLTRFHGNGVDDVVLTEDLAAHGHEVGELAVIDADSDVTVRSKQIARKFETRIEHVEPVGVVPAFGFSIRGKFLAVAARLLRPPEIVRDAVFEVIRVDEVMARVVRRIDVNELDVAVIVLLEHLEDLEVIAFDESIRRRVPVPGLALFRTQRCGSGQLGGTHGALLARPEQAKALRSSGCVAA